MPDYQPYPSRAMRRPLRYAEGELSEPAGDLRPDLEPAPKPWPIVPYLAVFLVLGFLSLQMYPATHWRHPNDRSRTWIKHLKPGEKPEILQAEGKDEFYSTLDEVEVQQAGDLAVEEDLIEDEDHGEHTSAFLKKAGAKEVNIYVCTDENDFRPIAVLVNSTIINALHPERLHFHLVLPPSLRSNAKQLSAFFATARIKISSDFIPLKELEQHITIRKKSKTRPELQSPYNFVPFLLPGYFNDVDRIIYLDADIVVKGNIEELMQVNLDGKAAAAVEDCSQTFDTYFDFKQLSKIQERSDKPAWVPDVSIDPKTCVYNRGVLVINTKQWIKQEITEAILWWMDEYHNATDVLYKYGLSQPPFLLALYGKYKKLDAQWNVRGLGRDAFSEHEQEYMEQKYDLKPEKKPFISPDADAAKILHFNGKFKPWKRQRPVGKTAPKDVVSRCGPKGIECSKLWWEYLGPLADAILMHHEDAS